MEGRRLFCGCSRDVELTHDAAEVVDMECACLPFCRGHCK
jgi:hypothetical protein